MKKLILITALSLFLSSNLSSADYKKADFTLKCSAVYYIMTSLLDEELKPFSDQMKNLSYMMGLISVELSYNMSNGELTNKRDIQADKLLQNHKKNKDFIIDLYARCDKYREDLAHISNLDPENWSNNVESLEIPRIIKMNQQKTETIKLLIEKSISNLEELGIKSFVEFNDSMNNL